MDVSVEMWKCSQGWAYTMALPLESGEGVVVASSLTAAICEVAADLVVSAECTSADVEWLIGELRSWLEVRKREGMD